MINNDYTIIIDTREQQPWEFFHQSTAHQKLNTGDYSIQGLEDTIVIERKKSVSEIATNIIENRFKDVLQRLQAIKHKFILLEFDLDDVFKYPEGSNIPKSQWKRIRISPTFILKNIIDWNILYNIPTIFCGSSYNAEKMASYLFKKIYYQHLNNGNSDET
jgi:hypothetical protein